ncbi:MAG: DsrE family protein [Polyangiaceae bacterium]|nr:DsrE family protein [Polyangiaceae bacterium]
MKDKTVIVVLADPKSGSEEALGRVFNALATAYDLKERGRPFSVVFQGTGTRWIGELAKESHPAHALFNAVRDHVDGVCGGCADIFGGGEEAQEAHLPLLRDLKIPGTGGLTSLAGYLDEGARLISF